jgi:transposase
MTVQTQVSGQVQVSVFIPRDYDVFAGLDVDHHSIATTFTDHGRLQRSLRLPYSARQLLNYVRKHFAGQRVAFVYEAGPTGFGLYDELVAAQHTCLVVAPPMVPRDCIARRRTEKHSCAGAEVSRAAASGATAGQPGQAVNGDQMTDQGAVAL